MFDVVFLLCYSNLQNTKMQTVIIDVHYLNLH